MSAEDRDAVMAQHRVREIFHDGLPIDLIMDVVELDDRAAETAAREADFHRAAVEIRRLRLDLFVALDACFLLCRARLCAAPQPLELVSKEILPPPSPPRCPLQPATAAGQAAHAASARP